MKINIPSDVAKTLKTALKSLEVHNPDDFHWRDFLEVDLTDRPVNTVQQLRELLAPHIKVKGIRAGLRDIDAWLLLQNGEKQPKARACKDAVGLLKAYIGMSSRKHVYQNTSAADGAASLAYYVSKVEYNPPRGDSEASVSFDLKCIEFGEVHSTSHSWQTSEVRGKTPQEILSSAGYSLETVPLRDDYEYYLERYGDVIQPIGVQYLATGIGQIIKGNSRWWRSTVRMEDDQGNPSRVVVDLFDEEKTRNRSAKGSKVSGEFWVPKIIVDEDADAETLPPSFVPEVPIHPYVVVFHLKQHERMSVHIQNLTKYEYDTEMRQHLVLPDRDQALLDVLLADTHSRFKDIIKGKTGGVVVLCQGPPGTGKTLTAEVYAEGLQRPLYTVQCSQLGIDAETLEKELLQVFARASRWGAVLLLDEADVYIHERGSDLVHNAIVGVFLRVLEYYDGVLFMTTNRGDTVDDAVLSRCTARVVYGVPPIEHQRRIWAVLMKANGVEPDADLIYDITTYQHDLSGRDIKNLLKLCMMVQRHTGRTIDTKLVGEMRQFKPTMNVGARELQGTKEK